MAKLQITYTKRPLYFGKPETHTYEGYEFQNGQIAIMNENQVQVFEDKKAIRENFQDGDIEIIDGKKAKKD